MSGKKKSSKTLLFVFLALLVVVAITQVSKSRKGERTLRKDFITATADEVTGMSLYMKSTGYSEVSLSRENEVWRINYAGKSYRADQDLVNGMVDELLSVTPGQLVAKTKDSWSNFDVTDSSATRVVLNGGKKKLGELYIGRFAYNQATRKPTTYLRMAGDKETYGVDAYLSMTFSRDVNGLRDKSIFRGNRSDMVKLSFTYPGDSSFTLSKEQTTWLLNGAAADSATTAQYLNAIAYTVGTEFNDDFNPANFSGDSFLLVIERIDMPLVEIRGYVDGNGVVVGSSENPENYFTSGSANIFDKVFKSPAYFAPKTE